MHIKQYKIARRVGERVFPKTENPKFTLTKKRRTQKNRPRPLSEYGMQMTEKQKVRYLYGLRERQFSNYVKSATKQKNANPAQSLFARLETRLDNIVYRLGFAKTRRHARQLVSHGHIYVNQRKIRIPSYPVREGDRVYVREGSQAKPEFQNLENTLQKQKVPAWITLDVKKKEGTMSGKPILDEKAEILFNLTSVIEFYSR